MDSVNIFTCMGFDEPSVCLHTFREHTLFYVYSGSMVLSDGELVEDMKVGDCAFIRKGETLRLTVMPESEDCHVMKMTLPRSFLCELYHCQFSGHEIPDREKIFSGHILPDNAGTTSLFQSLMPFYDFGMEVPHNLYRLKLTEAVLALLMQCPESKKWLFDFSVNPLHLLDVVKNSEPTPMEWHKINAECPISLN